MHLAKPTDVDAVYQHACSAARMEHRKLCAHRGHRARRDEHREVALDVEEIDEAGRRPPLFRRGIAVGEAAETHRLIVPLRRAPVAATGLEDANALLFSREVRAQNVNEPAGERGAHRVEMRGDRVPHPNGRSPLVPRREQRSFPCRAHEIEGDGLLPTARHEHALDRYRRTRRLRSGEHRLPLW
jgi:hypothetical protein